jgi:cyclic pyranopterin phosphate synthase
MLPRRGREGNRVSGHSDPGLDMTAPPGARATYCEEGFYGVRLYRDRTGGYRVGVCIQRMDLARPLSDFMASGLPEQIRELRRTDHAALTSGTGRYAAGACYDKGCCRATPKPNRKPRTKRPSPRKFVGGQPTCPRYLVKDRFACGSSWPTWTSSDGRDRRAGQSGCAPPTWRN